MDNQVPSTGYAVFDNAITMAFSQLENIVRGGRRDISAEEMLNLIGKMLAPVAQEVEERLKELEKQYNTALSILTVDRS